MATLQNFALTGNPITETVTTTSAISRVLSPENGASVTLRAEPFGGTAQIRYDGVLRTFYADGRTIYDGCNVCYKDTAISAIASIGSTKYVFARGVAQYGESQVAPTLKILSTLPRIKWYSGYELGIVFAVASGTNYDVCINSASSTIEQSQEHTQIGNAVVFCDLTTNPYGGGYNGTILLTDDGETTDSIAVAKTTVPAHPFYVRWINNRGGYDYFMFACNQKHTRALGDNVYFEKYGANGAQTTISKSGVETVEVSTGIVDAETMAALAMLQFSPDIRWYNESTAAWTPVQINAADSEIMAEQPTGEYIISFVLPDIQINK